MAEWLTSDDRDTLAVLWSESDTIMDDEALDIYLSAAKSECLAYAPKLRDGEPVPDGWIIAQVMHARNKYNAGATGPGGDLDGSGYGLTAFPLDWQVKQLLRPQRGLGAIV